METTASILTLIISPIFVFDFASGGQLQYSVTPITFSPSPRSKIISVAAGASDNIRRGPAAMARPAAHSAAMAAKTSMFLSIRLIAITPVRYFPRITAADAHRRAHPKLFGAAVSKFHVERHVE
jgi:hypothetical protein